MNPQEQNLKRVSLTQTEFNWIKEHIQPQWNVGGNCSWFVNHNGKDYGPISPDPRGGFTFIGNSTRYESVFGAASRMMAQQEL